MKRRLVFILFLSALFLWCPQAPAQAWWRDSVFYQIFVRSFYDSDGDGVGDFNGVTRRLDYVKSLGATAIWLMPVNPSPSYHGYDVTDFYNVHPHYGTMADFKHLIAEAHRRDIRIIVDLVLNHTSSQHPWFQSANSDPQSPRRAWYRWSDEHPGQHWHPGNKGYYYGMFWSEMPDLNYLNPDVTAEMKNVSLYWLQDVGVDGFRIDAAKHLVEEDHHREGALSNQEWLRAYYAAINKTVPDAYLLGEIWEAGSLDTTHYQGGLDQIFNFELARESIHSAQGGSGSGIRGAMASAIQNNPEGDFASFLRNHDQERVMSTLRGNVHQAKVAAFLLLTSPGTPFLYYGEEIGMTGVKPDETIRAPMQWNTNTSAGFSTATPWISIHDDYLDGVNVTDQIKSPDSLWNHYRALIRLRKEHRALRTGRTALVETGHDSVWAMLRYDNDATMLVLVNLSERPVGDYYLSMNDDRIANGIYKPTTLFGTADAQPLRILQGQWVDFKPRPELDAYQMLVLKIK